MSTITRSLVLIITAAAVYGDLFERTRSPWTFTCSNQFCHRKLKSSLLQGEQEMNLNECKLTCRNTSMLWPVPTSVKLGNKGVRFSLENIKHNFLTPSLLVHEMTVEAFNIFKSYFSQSVSTDSPPPLRVFDISISIAHEDAILTYNTDESYILSIEDDSVNSQVSIKSNTFFGARHALETLSQLIYKDEETSGFLVVNEANITDRPVYPHRGISVDTSRNYYPLSTLKKVVDGMSYNKMNILHWHITDTNSFPFISRREPNMALYGAYSKDNVYHPSDVKAFVDYARVRGVKVIPELDTPAHVGHGWEWGELEHRGRFVFCLEQIEWQDYCLQPPCGQINAANPAVYKVLENIFHDFLEVFDNDITHFGGDEISKRCWTDPTVAREAVEWMTRRNLTTDEAGVKALWNHYNVNSYKALKAANGGKDMDLILWSNKLTNLENIDTYIDKSRFIIQIWANLNNTANRDIWSQILQKGYRLILSNSDALYLDCGFGPWVGGPTRFLNNWCSPYKSWHLLYENRPEVMLNQTQGVMGQEATIWSEEIDGHSIEGRIWPRASALAERTWSDPETGWAEAEHRLVAQRERMVQRGLHPERLQPRWCYEHEGRCFRNPDKY